MPEVRVLNEVDIDGGYFVEGVPGAGLASKIATDHLIDRLDMELHATIEADGIPEVMIFEEGRDLHPPVRIFADEETGIYAMTSDVLLSAVDVEGFADLMIDWLTGNGTTPLLLSGLPSGEEEKDMYGVAVGDGAAVLDEVDIPEPADTGLVGGPTGAMLHIAARQDMDALCLVVETDPQFPDPTAAKLLLEDGVEPLTGIDVETEVLEDQAEDIREQKQKLAQMIQQAESHEKSQAFPEGMYE